MAFDSSDLVLLSHGNDKKLFYYDGDVNSDTLASIADAGYFNNSDDDIRMSADDLILAKGTDGAAVFEVISVSSGSVTTREVGGGSSVLDSGTTAAVLPATGLIRLGETTAGTHELPIPTPGNRVTLIGTGVAAHIVTTTASLSIGSTGATTLTLGNIGSGVELLAASSTQYLIVGSIEPTSTGSVSDKTYALT